MLTLDHMTRDQGILRKYQSDKQEEKAKGMEKFHIQWFFFPKIRLKCFEYKIIGRSLFPHY